MVIGRVFLDGEEVHRKEKHLQVHCESELETAEYYIRYHLEKFIFDCFEDRELNKVRIEITSDIVSH